MRCVWFTLLFLPFGLYAQTNAESTEATPAGAATVNTVVPASVDSTALELTHKIMPAYPVDEKTKLQGQVTLKADVSETGSVDGTTVISGDPTLAQAAAAAVKEWTFKPFIRNGQAVRVSTNISFDFVFREKADDKAGQSSSTAPARDASTQGSHAIPVVWIAQDLARSLKVKEVKPVYPPIAKLDRVQGTVVLFALIGKDGTVRQVSVIRGDRLLTQTSLDAVKQWRYKPYVLDGEAVAWQTKVNVIFSLVGY